MENTTKTPTKDEITKAKRLLTAWETAEHLKPFLTEIIKGRKLSVADKQLLAVM